MVRAHVPSLIIAGLICVMGCSPAVPASEPAAAAGPAAPVASNPGAAGDTVLMGVVAETIDSGGYTYVRLKRDADEVWIAAREFDARVGEELSIAVAMTMHDFRSPTLNRSFPVLYFASEVARKGETLTPPRTAPAPPPMPPVNSHGTGEAPATAPSTPPIARMDPPAGGLSVADVYARRSGLAGKPVVVRGTVVKVNRGILDRNWLHLQDGSGSTSAQDHDLTITTGVQQPSVQVGDVVTARGVLALKRDFGAGYVYDAILEDAILTR